VITVLQSLLERQILETTKRQDRKWGDGDDISVLEFKSTEYGQATKVVATEEVKNDIKKIGIKKCARESGFTRFFVRKLLRGRTVRRNSYNRFVRWLQDYKMAGQIVPESQ
jgi:hypothetical protein